MATIYYVSTSGSDSNNGTSLATPFRTVTHGVSVLVAGDTLFVRVGTYHETLLSAPAGTSWDNKIRIAAYPSETVWLSPTSVDRVIYFSNAEQYIEFDGINLDGSGVNDGTIVVQATAADRNAHHIRFQNAEVIGSPNFNILTVAQGFIGAQSNEFINLNVHGGGLAPVSPDFDHAIYLSSSDNLVEDCDISDAPGGLVHVYNGYGIDIGNNIVRNNRIHDGHATVAGQRHWGVIVASGTANQVYNNLVYGIPNDGASSVGIYVFPSGAATTGIYNNTVYGNAGEGIAIESGVSGTIVRNDISYNNTGGNYRNSGSATTADHNLFGVDPVFVNAGAHNFALQATSPAINTGTTIAEVPTDFIATPRPQGFAYDIGAYEYILSPLVPQTLWYVATTGSDTTGNGTITKPLGTIRQAVAQLVAGSTLYIRGGTYLGAENVIDSTLGTIASGTNFTTGAITIAGYPNERVEIQPPDGQGGILFAGTQHHLIVQDLMINMILNTVAGVGPDGVVCTNGAHHNRFQRVTVQNNSSSGFTTYKASGLSPDSNEFLSCVSMNNGRMDVTNSGYGFFLFADSTTVQNCVASGNNGHGILIGGNPSLIATGTVITGNRIASNVVHGTDTGFGTASYGIYSTYTATTTISNNVIVQNQGGVYIGPGSAALQLLNNTITDNTQNVGGLEYAILLDGYTSAPTIDSNIIFNNGNNAGNLGGGIQNNGGTGTPVVVHNTITDPNFVNPPTDVSLSPGSPAIGTGAPVPVVPTDVYGVTQPTPSDTGSIVFTPTPIATTVTIGTTVPATPPVTSTYTVPITVAPTAGTSVPSGTVTVNDGVGHVVSAPVTAGTATVTLPSPPTAQTVTLTATFSGVPAPFAPSTDTAAVQIGATIPAPPTNTTIGTASNLGSTLPVTVTQQADSGGTTFDLWFAVTIPVGVVEIGPWAYGNFGTWNPVLTCWRGPIGAPVQIGNAGHSVPMQVAVDAGETIYFKTVKPAGNVSPAITTFTCMAAPSLSVPVGSILINDSSDGFPLVALSGTTTQTVLKFYHPFPAGESNRVLTTGEVMMSDDFGTVRSGAGPIIYGPGLTAISVPTMPAAGYVLYGTDQTTGWWAMKPGGGATHAFIVFVSKSGTVSGTTYDLGASSAAGKSLTPNLANTVVYFINNTANVNHPVQQVTIPGGVVSDVIAGDANYILRPGLTTMLDDSLLVGYSRTGVANEVRRFVAGVLANTFSLGASDHPEQIFTAIDDPNSFWVWTISGVTNRFRNIKVSDGSVLHDLSSVEFVNGVYQDSASAMPTARFGSDFSCVPWITRLASGGGTTRGTMRRQRRFLLPSSDQNNRMRIPTLEMLMRTGIGLTPAAADATPVVGSNPQAMMRLSLDGGMTWTNERWRSAGEQGQYRDRVRWLQATGIYRNAVCEVTLSDPVDWQLLAMMGIPVESSS